MCILSLYEQEQTLRKVLIAAIAVAVPLAIGGAYYFGIVPGVGHGDWRKDIVKVEKGSVDVKIEATGTIKPFNEVKVSPKLTGLIKQLMVKQGDVVKEGQVIAQMDVSNIFGEGEDPVGKSVLIRGELFHVVGVMEHKGMGQFNDNDDQIFVPLTTGYNTLFGSNAATGRIVKNILVQAKSEDEVSQAEFQITNVLRQRHKCMPPIGDDFMIRTQVDLMQTAQSVTEVFTLLLGATASVSLLVGGIGIMNIMLVSVTERTREIGIRKAIGARYYQIMAQFVIEAMVLSLSGGVIGILVGLGGAYLVGYFAKWTTEVTPLSVVLSFIVSIAIGLFFGIYPARKAAKLDPITALRAE